MTKESNVPEKTDSPKGSPVPSGAMYIGLCTTRAQSANLRWQKAIVFMALNGAIGGWCFQVFEYGKANTLFGIAFIALVMFGANLLFKGLVSRANQWIDYFTERIESIERAYGTESGVFVFADDNYLAKQSTEPLVRGLRFRQGIQTLSTCMIGIWGFIFLVSIIAGSYLRGAGAW